MTTEQLLEDTIAQHRELEDQLFSNDMRIEEIGEDIAELVDQIEELTKQLVNRRRELSHRSNESDELLGQLKGFEALIDQCKIELAKCEYTDVM